MENFEVKGDWWLPEDRDNMMSGTLKYDPAIGGVLELIGSFGGDFRFEDYEIIHGLSFKAFTLYKCRTMQSKMQLGSGFRICTFKADTIFRGLFFDDLEDLTLNKLTCQIYQLNNWYGKGGFDFEDDREHRTTTIYHSFPDAVKVELEDSLELKIGSHFNIGYDIFEPQLSHNTTVEIRDVNGNPRPFEEMRSVIRHFQRFVALGITEATYPTHRLSPDICCKKGPV